jgi:hypothetical protein
MRDGASEKIRIAKGNWVLRESLLQCHFIPPQIQHELTQATAVKNLQPATWAIAGVLALHCFSLLQYCLQLPLQMGPPPPPESTLPNKKLCLVSEGAAWVIIRFLMLTALRMSVRSSLYDRTNKSSHKHEFGPETYSEADDTYTHSCITCDYAETFEKMWEVIDWISLFLIVFRPYAILVVTRVEHQDVVIVRCVITCRSCHQLPIVKEIFH